MNLFEEITGFVDNDFKITYGLSVSIFDFEKIYITGYKRLGKVENNEIEIILKTGKVLIEGEDLKIKLLQKKEIYVVGKIKGINKL